MTDGVSSRPLPEKPRAEWQFTAYHIADRREDHRGKWPQYTFDHTVRIDRCRYVECTKAGGCGQPFDRELYDYRIDPLETRNHINEPNNVDLINQLSELLWEWESIIFEDPMP